MPLVYAIVKVTKPINDAYKLETASHQLHIHLTPNNFKLIPIQTIEVAVHLVANERHDNQLIVNSRINFET